MQNRGRTPRRKLFKFGLFLAILFILFYLVLYLVRSAQAAAGDVTLTASGFSDPDVEDTFQASEWFIRDSGGTVYDQVAGAVTSVTVSAATFTNGTSYWWKVRYQDQHTVWSDWSDEAGFIYGSSSTPTPTPTPSSTTTLTPSATPTPSATMTVCTVGLFACVGDWCGCLDAPQPRNLIYVP